MLIIGGRNKGQDITRLTYLRGRSDQLLSPFLLTMIVRPLLSSTWLGRMYFKLLRLNSTHPLDLVLAIVLCISAQYETPRPPIL